MHYAASSAIDHLDRQRKPLVMRSAALIAGFCLLLLGLHFWSLMVSRQEQLDETATSTANMARALASQAERSLKVGDLILGEMVERIEQGKPEADAEQHLHARLAAIVKAAPEIQELFLYGADGLRIATSLPVKLPGSNADREFFRYHQTHADRSLHIGKPIRSRSTGILTIPLSRRIDRADGSFGGVAMASLRLSFFGNFYDSFNVGKTGTIILAIDDGTLLYRRPFNPAMVGSDVGNTVVFQMYRKDGPVGSGLRVARLDGIERMYSYRHLEGFPLLVAIARSRDEILADWWTVVFKMSGVVLFAVALLAWGGVRMVRQIRVREALETELRLARASLEGHNVSLQALADTDGLTGLANRRRFETTLAREHERARRNGMPCSLILTDVDFFKKYNDRYGHVAGDDCLRRVAAAIGSGTRRPTDLAARYGGEEFAVILPDTDLEGARAVAENMRAAVAALHVLHADSPCGHVSISLGVVTVHPAVEGGDPLEWVEAADTLLYRAKAAGRNCAAACDGRTLLAA
ncbi:diguanylate cyclase [Massilia forsythiae]|uniref:diguanylate cyclase n=1 Tax=Massilia forsythiae TaxID=2728020 RepID=A0A7Z2ZU21_9BURK|nr:GGDEF domain-containing protein [Massilia forsythiae]QJE01840.1 diguanylate cyclase [Massilia forsythiae]